MSERIFMMNHNDYYEVTDLIPQHMENVNCTETQAIKAFMEALGCMKYKRFPENVSNIDIAEWVVKG
jgi:hypothetical protein